MLPTRAHCEHLLAERKPMSTLICPVMAQDADQRAAERLLRTFEEACLEVTGKRKYLSNPRTVSSSKFFTAFKKLLSLARQYNFNAIDYVRWSVGHNPEVRRVPNFLLSDRSITEYRRFQSTSKQNLLNSPDWISRTQIDTVRTGIYLDCCLLEQWEAIYPDYLERLLTCCYSLTPWFLATDSAFIAAINNGARERVPETVLREVMLVLVQLSSNKELLEQVKVARDAGIKLAAA